MIMMTGYTLAGWALNGALSADYSDMSSENLALMRHSPELYFSWGDTVVQELEQATNILKVTKDPAAMQDTTRTNGGGFQCSDTSMYLPVTTECVQGTCNMPSTMYMGVQNGKVVYNRGYGLVDPYTSGNGQCDWAIDSQGFVALYLMSEYSTWDSYKDSSGSMGHHYYTAIWTG